MEELSTPEIALLTMLQDGNDPDSVSLQEHFSREFPGSSYAETLASLREAGLIDEPVPREEPRGVRFSKLSPLHLRVY